MEDLSTLFKWVSNNYSEVYSRYKVLRDKEKNIREDLNAAHTDDPNYKRDKKYQNEREYQENNEAKKKVMVEWQDEKKPLIENAIKIVLEDVDEFKIDASTGQGGMIESPYVSIMHKSITTTTTAGIYLVYLFNKKNNSDTSFDIYLALEIGSKDPFVQEAKDRNSNISNYEIGIAEEEIKQLKGFSVSDENLSLDNKDYERGVVVYKKYTAEDLEETTLEEDLKSLFDLYNRHLEDFKEIFKNSSLIERAKTVTDITDKGEEMDIKTILDELGEGDDRQIIFNGAPGTGKTYSIREWMKEHCTQFEKEITDINKGVWEFVQFHPSYDYTDFVEGLRPVKLNPSEKDSTFVRLDGVFKRFCRAAENDYRAAEKPEEARKYYFVIDEINRADLGKVFGELMFGLEEDYRGEDNAFPTQYMNLPTYHRDNDDCYKPYVDREDCYEKGFFIPKNVYIIGTMNDIDRSVDSLDFAMRRRFKWEEVTAMGVMESVLRDMIAKEINKDTKDLPEAVEDLIQNLVKKMKAVNEKIEKADKKLGLSKDYCIGPAYLKDFRTYAKNHLGDAGSVFNENDEEFKKCIKKVWDNKIHQILINYCRGRDESTTRDFIKICGQSFGVEAEQKENEEQTLDEE